MLEAARNEWEPIAGEKRGQKSRHLGVKMKQDAEEDFGCARCEGEEVNSGGGSRHRGIPGRSRHVH